MRREISFKWRITRAFAFLTAVVLSFFILAVALTFQSIEHQLFGQRLMKEVHWLAEKVQHGKQIDLPPGRHYFVDEAIPESLANLWPGYYDIEKARTANHVAVYNHGGHRYVLVSDESDFEHLEDELYWILLLGGIGGLAVSAWLGMLLANRIIAPLTALSDAVSQSQPEYPLPGIHLPDEIGTLARVFTERATELQGFLTREQLFTGDVSHELRTPLTVIMGAAELVHAQAGQNPAMQSAADRILRSTQDMTERVRAFLLLSRAPEALDAPRIALNPILEHEWERCQGLLAGKAVVIDWQVKKDVVVNAHPELAAIAIGNLLRNACLYTDQGSIGVCLAEHAITITNSGSGLPENVRAHLFNRLPSTMPSGGGSGLGLAIVKRICDHLGWTIQLAEDGNSGTSFTLTFSPAVVPGANPD